MKFNYESQKPIRVAMTESNLSARAYRILKGDRWGSVLSIRYFRCENGQRGGALASDPINRDVLTHLGNELHRSAKYLILRTDPNGIKLSEVMDGFGWAVSVGQVAHFMTWASKEMEVFRSPLFRSRFASSGPVGK